MPNGTYGGVRGKETKVGQKTFVSRPTRLSNIIPAEALCSAQWKFIAVEINKLSAGEKAGLLTLLSERLSLFKKMEPLFHSIIITVAGVLRAIENRPYSSRNINV